MHALIIASVTLPPVDHQTNVNSAGGFMPPPPYTSNAVLNNWWVYTAPYVLNGVYLTKAQGGVEDNDNLIRPDHSPLRSKHPHSPPPSGTEWGFLFRKMTICFRATSAHPHWIVYKYFVSDERTLIKKSNLNLRSALVRLYFLMYHVN